MIAYASYVYVEGLDYSSSSYGNNPQYQGWCVILFCLVKQVFKTMHVWAMARLTWFLEIVLVRPSICVCACVCVSTPKPPINNQWLDIV